MEYLKKFCSKDENKYTLQEPFSQGDFTYATDGGVAIRVSRVADIGEKDGTPDMKRVPWDHSCIKDFVALPDHNLDEKIPCKRCRGTGRITVCHECDGDGEVHFNNGYNNYSCCCKTCNGDGELMSKSGAVCEACHGSGIHYDQPVKFGNAAISAHLLARISELPGAKISPSKDRCSPFRFIFDGGWGLVMPMQGAWED